MTILQGILMMVIHLMLLPLINEWPPKATTYWRILLLSPICLAYTTIVVFDKRIPLSLILVTGFSGTLGGWWDSYLTEESRDSIKHAVKKNDEGLCIFDESFGCGIPDGVNTLIYTILKHFVGTLNNISSQVSDYLNNLRCPTMSDYRWYQDFFISRVML